MNLAIAMLVAHIPLAFWAAYEYKRQEKEKNKH